MVYEYPEEFARFYDVIYDQVRDTVDHKYFLDRILAANGPVLEVGVGTGRLFTDALSQGADIYGLDVSHSMIDVLRNKIEAKQHKRISIQSITDFSYLSGFDLIIAPFRVFMHLLDKKEQLEALNNVYRHLNPEGIFIFDIFVPDLNQLINGIDNLTDFEGEYEDGKKLKRTVSTQPDLINQLIHIHFQLEWDENETTQKADWHVPLRFFFRYELEHLLERSFFTKFSIKGDFKGNKLDKHAKEFVVHCQKE